MNRTFMGNFTPDMGNSQLPTDETTEADASIKLAEQLQEMEKSIYCDISNGLRQGYFNESIMQALKNCDECVAKQDVYDSECRLNSELQKLNLKLDRMLSSLKQQTENNHLLAKGQLMSLAAHMANMDDRMNQMENMVTIMNKKDVREEVLKILGELNLIGNTTDRPKLEPPFKRTMLTPTPKPMPTAMPMPMPMPTEVPTRGNRSHDLSQRKRRHSESVDTALDNIMKLYSGCLKPQLSGNINGRPTGLQVAKKVPLPTVQRNDFYPSNSLNHKSMAAQKKHKRTLQQKKRHIKKARISHSNIGPMDIGDS